jgi:hypothetical protein
MLKVLEGSTSRNQKSQDDKNGVGLGTALDELARHGARRMIAAALKVEADDYVARFAEERDGDGRALVVRNGSARPRPVTTGTGTFELKAPRVNDTLLFWLLMSGTIRGRWHSRPQWSWAGAAQRHRAERYTPMNGKRRLVSGVVIGTVLAAIAGGFLTPSRSVATELPCVKLRTSPKGPTQILLINSCTVCMEVVWLAGGKTTAIRLQSLETKTLPAPTLGETLNEHACK